MHGSRDRIIPWQAGRYLARTIAGARLQLLEGVGHAPFISRPRECVEIWRSFLK
jgi:pimeloyl-[acyl-carrier protein] methyl ester esterase